ncbi:DUF1471 family protein YbiJ [Siccibacter turicensis]|uniref:DUF1471 family protein YbiJ n=1 Tax=Siccibacter turicensis TaxID=357233 RepID=UPI00102127FC|nr:DUF1471 family protein YbiJ [Siccibacter turicensis]
MKTIKYAVASLALTAFSLTAGAAELIGNTDTQNLNKVGVVSAQGASTLEGLEAELGAKADAAGAKAYSITSAMSHNKVSGTAVIYN